MCSKENRINTEILRYDPYRDDNWGRPISNNFSLFSNLVYVDTVYVSPICSRRYMIYLIFSISPLDEVVVALEKDFFVFTNFSLSSVVTDSD